MANRNLSKNDLQICRRVQEARQRLGITAAECAAQIDIPRTTLLNYEAGKTAVRAETALRFCRQFIVSEEWLATGQYAVMRRAAAKRGMNQTDIFEQMTEFFFRQSVDLLTEAQNRGISLRSHYSIVYSSSLAPFYELLCQKFFYMPRIIMRDSDSRDLLHNLTYVILARWLRLLDDEALRRQVEPGFVRREFFGAYYEAGCLIWKRFMGSPTPEIYEPHLAWFRVIAADPNAPIGSMHAPGYNGERNTGEPIPAPAIAGSEKEPKKLLACSHEVSDNDHMKAILRTLLERVRKACEEHGRKSELAASLKVPPQTLSAWLSGKQKPSGENALRLLQWVEQQERQ